MLKVQTFGLASDDSVWNHGHMTIRHVTEWRVKMFMVQLRDIRVPDFSVHTFSPRLYSPVAKWTFQSKTLQSWTVQSKTFQSWTFQSKTFQSWTFQSQTLQSNWKMNFSVPEFWVQHQNDKKNWAPLFLIEYNCIISTWGQGFCTDTSVVI